MPYASRLGYPYWSVAAFLKHKVKNAVSYIANFERAVAFEARRRGVDGMICGHIHRAEITEIDGVTYCNDGDWVESCTALRRGLRRTAVACCAGPKQAQLLGTGECRPSAGRDAAA